MVKEETKGWLVNTPSTPDLKSNGVDETSGKRLVVAYAVEQLRLIVACPRGGGILDNKKTSGGRKSCRNNSLEPT